MRKIFLYVLPIILIVTASLDTFAVLQIRAESQKQLDELKRKAKTVSESIELSVKYL